MPIAQTWLVPVVWRLVVAAVTLGDEVQVVAVWCPFRGVVADGVESQPEGLRVLGINDPEVGRAGLVVIAPAEFGECNELAIGRRVAIGQQVHGEVIVDGDLVVAFDVGDPDRGDQRQQGDSDY